MESSSVTTSLPGITGATTPSTFTDTTSNPTSYRIGALLTLPDTTVTALQVPGTMGQLVVDGTTLTWREEALTLSDGVVVSAGFNGLEDGSTTAELRPVTIASQAESSSSGGIYTIETINPSKSGTVFRLTSTHPTGTPTSRETAGGNSPSSSGGGGGAPAATASSSSTGFAAPTMSAGKAAVALVGALGGLVAYAL